MTIVLSILGAVSLVCLLIGSVQCWLEVQEQRRATKRLLDPAREAEAHAVTEAWHRREAAEAPRVARRDNETYSEWERRISKGDS